MNKLFVLLLFTALLVLGMSGGPANYENPRNPIKNLSPFLFVGDSIVYFNNTNNFTTVPNVNIGVSGSKVENQSTYISAFQGQSNRLVLWVGINNLGASDTPVQVAAKYWQLIQDQKNNFQKIYCLSVMPINHDQFYAAYGNLAHYMEITYLNVVSLNNYLKTICPNFIDIVKIVTIYDQNNSNYGELNPDFTKDGDGIHLNDAGYVAVFNVLNDYLYYR